LALRSALRYFAGFSSVRVDARNARFARRSAKRSIIWLRRPRGFFGVAAVGARRTGGGIFSNVNAGIVCPLAVEMNHLLEFPCYPDEAHCCTPYSIQFEWNLFKHSPCQMRPRMRLHCGLIVMILK
jgi:hypothetical protein